MKRRNGIISAASFFYFHGIPIGAGRKKMLPPLLIQFFFLFSHLVPLGYLLRRCREAYAHVLASSTTFRNYLCCNIRRYQVA